MPSSTRHGGTGHSVPPTPDPGNKRADLGGDPSRTERAHSGPAGATHCGSRLRPRPRQAKTDRSTGRRAQGRGTGVGRRAEAGAYRKSADPLSSKGNYISRRSCVITRSYRKGVFQRYIISEKQGTEKQGTISADDIYLLRGSLLLRNVDEGGLLAAVTCVHLAYVVIDASENG